MHLAACASCEFVFGPAGPCQHQDPLPIPFDPMGRALGSRRYATRADLADAVTPPPLSTEQGAELAGLLDAAGLEVAARLGRRWGC